MTEATTKHNTEQATYLPLGLIAASPTNPRKRFTQIKLDELAASIKKLGVFQPVLVRRNPVWTESNGREPYELVCGERRWRASKQADQASLLSIIRDLTDFEALEIQLLENMERDDLHALEEAEGLSKLLRGPKSLQGYASAEELAAKVGKSRRWVYLRLALLNLSEPVRKLFLDDELSTRMANLIVAYVPNQDQQLEAAQRILQGFNGEPYTTRTAEDFLRKQYMLDLAKAPFDIAATFTVAGPCSGCNKRSGANPDLFETEDVKRGDQCQDSTCFQAKDREHHERRLAEAEAAGHTVLRGPAATKLMPYAKNVLPSGFLWFDEPATALTADKRPLAEIFGAKQRGVITVEHSSGAIVRLVPEADARKLLKSKDLLRPPQPAITQAAATVAPAPAPSSAVAPKPVPLTKLQLTTRVETRAGELFSQMLAQQLKQHVEQAEQPPLLGLRLAIAILFDDIAVDDARHVFECMGWPAPEFGSRFMDQVRARLAELDGDRLGRILAHIVYITDLQEGQSLSELRTYHTHDALAFAEHYAIDVEALQDEADEGARTQVRNEECRRLGLPVPDGPATVETAFDAFAAAHAAASTANAHRPGTVKYRNAATGETWSGRGLQPKWMKAAMVAGAKLEDFEVRAS